MPPVPGSYCALSQRTALLRISAVIVLQRCRRYEFQSSRNLSPKSASSDPPKAASLTALIIDRLSRIYAFRYSSKAGPLGKLVTQPSDKISMAIQSRYLSQPYNLVRRSHLVSLAATAAKAIRRCRWCRAG